MIVSTETVTEPNILPTYHTQPSRMSPQVADRSVETPQTHYCSKQDGHGNKQNSVA
jgi:hypothetical protein